MVRGAIAEIEAPGAALLSPPPTPERPRLMEIATRVAVSLLVAVVAPATLFWATMVLFDLRVAIVVALVWTGAAMVGVESAGGQFPSHCC